MSTPAKQLERIFDQGASSTGVVGTRAITDRQETYTLVISATGGVSMYDPVVEQRFRQLATEWSLATGFLSDPSKKFSHPSYLKIIGMGEKALPFILREVERMSGHWFVALDSISPVNPVPPQDQINLQRTARAWINWGRREGYI